MRRSILAVMLGLAACSLAVNPDLSELESGGPSVCKLDEDCDDADACTDDVCDEGGCVHGPRDDDEDGAGRLDCGGDDCDDGDPDVRPDALEDCTDGEDQDCDDQIDLADQDCGPGPSNDTCADALVLSAESMRVVGNTTFRTDDGSPGCARLSYVPPPDVHFEVRLPSPREISLDTFESEFDTVLSLSLVCNDPGTEIACAGDVESGLDTRIIFRETPDASLFLRVDGEGPGAPEAMMGRYVLRYEVGPVRAQLTCSSPMDITGGAAVYGDTDGTSFSDEESGSCGGEGSSEEVYRFRLEERAEVQLATHGSNFDTSLYVRRGECRDGAPVECVEVPAATEETVLDLTAGTYYVFVDGAGGAEGEYRLLLNIPGG